MIRTPESIWVPKRVQTLLKVKKLLEGEATVVGYTSGVGKLHGLLGALIVQWEAKTFNLSGFTDAERELTPVGQRWATDNPGQTYPGSYSISTHFKLGDTVRFRYDLLTNEQLPRDARYWR